MTRRGFVIVVCAISIVCGGYSANAQTPAAPDKVGDARCPSGPKGERYILDESAAMKKKGAETPASPTSASTCVLAGSIKDDNGKVCQKGRLTYTKDDGAKVQICSEDASDAACDATGGCSPETLSALARREVPVETSDRTRELLSEMHRASERGDTARVATLESELAASQRLDIQQSLARAFSTSLPTDDTGPSVRIVETGSGSDWIERQFSGLTSNCESGDVCVREVIRGTADAPKAFIVPPEGMTISALTPGASDRELFERLDDPRIDKAWYTPVRDTFMPSGEAWYDKDTASPREMERSLFTAIQARASEMYSVPELAERISTITGGMRTVDLDTMRFSMDRYDPDGTLEAKARSGTPIEASRFADTLVNTWGDIRTMPSEIWKSPLMEPKELRIFESQGKLGGNDAPMLFVTPAFGIFSGAFPHETAHNMLDGIMKYDSDGSVSEAMSSYLYGRPIGLDEPLAGKVAMDPALGKYAETNIHERLSEAFRMYVQDPALFATVAQQDPNSELARVHNLLDATLLTYGVESTPLFARSTPYTWNTYSPFAFPRYTNVYDAGVVSDTWRKNTSELALKLFGK